MRLKLNSITPNIVSVVAEQFDSQYILNTKIKFLAKNLSKAKKDYFVLFSLSEELTKSLIGDPAELGEYTSRRKTSDNLIVSHNNFNHDIAGTPKYVSKYQQFSTTIKTVINREQINYLTVIVVSARPIQIAKTTAYILGNKDMLRIFQNGNVPRNNVALYEDLGQREMWLGSFYRDNQGTYRKENNSELYAKQVPNTKVSFKSQASKQLLKTISGNFDSLFDFNKGLNSKKSIYNKLSQENTNYFSDLFFAKTKNLDLPISFSFNRLAFYQNNTLFGGLIKNKSQLLSAVEIKNIRFLRKRIKTFNPSSRLTAFGPTDDFDTLETPIETEIKYVDIINNSGILTIQGTDKQIDDITYGLYQYGVEMTFVDKTADKITGLISSKQTGLAPAVNKLNEILAEASLPNNYNAYSQEFNEAYRLRYIQDEKPTVIKAIKDYVSVLAVFYENFSLSLRESPNSLALKIYNQTDPLKRGPEGLQELTSIIGNLISELELFVKKSALQPGSTADQKMKTSKLGGRSRLIKKKHFFKQIIDADTLTDNGYDYLSVELSDAQEPKYSNFRLISYSEFDRIKRVETSKYDSLSFEPSDDLALTPNYFSLNGDPEQINTQDPEASNNVLQIATQIMVAKIYRNSPIDFATSTINNNSTTESNTAIQTIKNSVLLADKNSCRIQINSSNQKRSIFDVQKTAKNTDNHLDAAEKMSEQSEFVTNKESSVSLNNFIFSISNNDTETTYLKKIQKLNTSMLSYLTQTDYFNLGGAQSGKVIKNITDSKVFHSRNSTLESFQQEIDDQQKTKIFRPTIVNTLLNVTENNEFYPPQELVYNNIVSSPVQASQMAAMAMKFGNIKKIEYIAGFRQSADTVFMKAPMWAPLTEGVYNSSTTANRTLMCRFVEYASQFSKYEGVKYPIYDEIFLIGPAPAPSGTTSLPQPPVINSLEQTETTPEELEYSFADLGGVNYDRPENQPPYESPNEDLNSNLYTGGNDFLLPNGDKYVGHYHIHYDSSSNKLFAMVGRVHAPIPHDKLTPVSSRAQRILKKAAVDLGVSY